MLSTNVMQFENFSRNVYRKKMPNCYVENIAEKTLRKIFVVENCFSTDNLLKYKQLNPAYNNGLHQLLGLRLLFSSSWKIIWLLQLCLSQKFCRFVLVSDCSSNWCKLYTLYASFVDANKIFQRNLVDLFWSVIAAATGASRRRYHQLSSKSPTGW